MSLASIVKRGNPLYTFQYLLNNSNDTHAFANGFGLYSATPTAFGGNIYFYGLASTVYAKISSADPFTHVDSNITTSVYFGGGPTAMGFLAGPPSGNSSSSNPVVVNFVVCSDCNDQTTVYRINSQSNEYSATYSLSINDPDISTISNYANMRTLCLRQIDYHNATMLINSPINTPLGILNAAITISDYDFYVGGGNMITERPTLVLPYTSFWDITGIVTSPTHFYYIGSAIPLQGQDPVTTIFYGGTNGSSFVALPNIGVNILDATFDPLGNMWYTSWSMGQNTVVTYSLWKYSFNSPDVGFGQITKVLGVESQEGGGFTTLSGHIPTKGIVIIDSKGNGYYNAKDDTYMIKPYYTY